MWMSDKPAVQQELALRIASLLQYFSSPSSAFQFLRCFYITMNREWNGIDNLRLNKFYSLQRRMVEESLKIAISDIFNQKNEDDENDEDFTEKESECIFLWSASICESLNEDSCPAIVLHLCDVFIDSLDKALPSVKPGDQILSDMEMNGLLLPFYDFLQNSGDSRIIKRVVQEVFNRVLTSKFEEKYDLDENEKFESDLERHNFMLSATYKYFPYFDSIEEALLSLATSKDTLEKNRTTIYKLIEKYQKIRVPSPTRTSSEKVIYKPLTSEEAKLLGKRKRKKHRKKPATKKPRK